MESEDHQQVLELLPWHVNGTLDEPERSRVAAHVAGCARCREELALYENVQTAVQLTDDAAWEPPPQQLGRLLERLEPGNEAGGLRGWWGTLAAPTRWVVAAQAAALAALALLAAWPQAGSGPGEYETLSSAPAEAAAGPRLAIAFAAETPEGELRALLQETGARIVEGPSPRGVYTLALEADAPLEDVVARLRAHPGVRLAEPFGDVR